MLFVCKHPTPHTQQKQRANARVESWEVTALLTVCGGCEDKDIYFQWYPREGFALQIPQLPQTKRSKKVSNFRHLFVFGYYGANSVCRHKCPKTKSVDLSTFCVAKFVRAPAASGKGTTSNKRVNPSTPKHATGLVIREQNMKDTSIL